MIFTLKNPRQETQDKKTRNPRQEDKKPKTRSMDAAFANSFFQQLDHASGINVTCGEQDPPCFSLFLAKMVVPDTQNIENCSCIKPGTWYITIEYGQGDIEVEINTTAFGYNKRKLPKDINIPLREMGLNRIYWMLQKIMQHRMDSANNAI